MIRKTVTFASAVALASALACGTARADEWDVASVSDASSSTSNVLFHGSEQVHDLAAAGASLDEDWYVVLTRPFSSYQMAVDGMTGDLRLAASDVQLLDTLGTTVQADARVADFGGTLSLVWTSGTSDPVGQFVRVRDAACGAACSTDDRYRIRFYDTTYAIARFNNTGSQATVAVVQNVTATECGLTYLFLNGSGTLVGSSSVALLPPRGTSVLATSTVVPGQSGSVRVVHTCGYGGLSGKAVSIEPSTGFTFDTPMTHRPR